MRPYIQPLTTRALQRMENRIKQRSVVGWSMTGSHYFRGYKVPGWVHLDLEGGGFLYYPENTPLETALADADDRGFSTSDARAKLAEWVATGKGATFTLKGD